jgi:hypothetical protein
MKSFLFRKDVLELKLKALEKYGEAQTRRLVMPQPHIEEHLEYGNFTPALIDKDGNQYPADYEIFGAYTSDGEYAWKPRYHVGQTVYIKEAYTYVTLAEKDPWKDRAIADGSFRRMPNGEPVTMGYKMDGYEIPASWSSPLFMPEWAARHFVVITGVGIGRLQDITIGDCLREGCPDYLFSEYEESEIELSYPPKINFVRLWNSLKPTYTWEDNPYVFVYKFKLKG